jgi:hypothetical protein
MDYKRIQLIERSYNLLLNAMHGKTISSYYNLDQDITITVTKMQHDIFMVKYDYENKPPLISQLNLPSDIDYYIKSFLRKKYTISSQIHYPDHYPYHAPTWALVDSTISLFEPVKQFTFFNQQLKDSWLPCVIIESDILNYIVWLQHLII